MHSVTYTFHFQNVANLVCSYNSLQTLAFLLSVNYNVLVCDSVLWYLHNIFT